MQGCPGEGFLTLRALTSFRLDAAGRIVISMGNMNLLEVILGCVALFCIFMLIMARIDKNKLVDTLAAMKSENKKLKDDLEDHKKKALKADKSDKRSDKDEKKEKPKESEDSAAIAELKDAIKGLKGELSKVKEKNYNLTKDNESLRKDIRVNAASNEQDQREIVALREAKVDLTASLDSANARISDLEKKLAEQSEKETPAAAPEPVSSEKDIARIADLEREKASLAASLKEVRAELGVFKRDFRAEVDSAKKEALESTRAMRKDLSSAQRQLDQARKRADSNHKVYLIARAQMLLAEKRLQALDPSYRPIIVLPSSNDAIDELLKKFAALDAREKRAAADASELNDKIKSLEDENAALKAKQSIGSFDQDDADSLKELVGNSVIIGKDIPNLTGIDTRSITEMDLSAIDEGWD